MNGTGPALYRHPLSAAQRLPMDLPASLDGPTPRYPPDPHPEAILLDSGNTLVFADRERMGRIYESAGVPWDGARFVEAELTARENLARRVQEGHVGTEPHLWREYFLEIFRRTRVPTHVVDQVGDRLVQEHERDHLWTHVEDGTAEALEGLVQRGYRVGVISNADGRMEDVLVRAGLRELVEFVLDSQVVGMEKPDPAIFHAGADRMGVPSRLCLYVGDLYPVDVVGARQAGMSALLLDPALRLTFPVDRIRSVQELPQYLDSVKGRD